MSSARSSFPQGHTLCAHTYALVIVWQYTRVGSFGANTCKESVTEGFVDCTSKDEFHPKLAIMERWWGKDWTNESRSVPWLYKVVLSTQSEITKWKSQIRECYNQSVRSWLGLPTTALHGQSRRDHEFTCSNIIPTTNQANSWVCQQNMMNKNGKRNALSCYDWALLDLIYKYT